MNHFLASFWITVFFFVVLWVASSERLHSKASLLKTRKASKNQKEILACTLGNDCSKTGKAQRERLCRSPVLEMLPCNFIKTGFHGWYFLKNVPTFSAKLLHKIHMNYWLERVFICLVRQIIIASAGQLSKCNKRSTVNTFTILVKFHKSLEDAKPFPRSIL